jgi:hypothetical protein
LYHTGMTGPGISVSGQYTSAVAIVGSECEINPKLFVETIKNHFSSYIQTLNNNLQTTKRSNFEKRFNFDNPFLTKSLSYIPTGNVSQTSGSVIPTAWLPGLYKSSNLRNSGNYIVKSTQCRAIHKQG